MKKFFYIILFLAILSISHNVIAETQADNSLIIRDDLLNNKQEITNDTQITKKEQTYTKTQNNNISKQSTNVKKDDTKKPPEWWRQRGSYFGLGHIFD